MTVEGTGGELKYQDRQAAQHEDDYLKQCIDRFWKGEDDDDNYDSPAQENHIMKV